jgi:hypothetical protein
MANSHFLYESDCTTSHSGIAVELFSSLHSKYQSLLRVMLKGSLTLRVGRICLYRREIYPYDHRTLVDLVRAPPGI